MLSKIGLVVVGVLVIALIMQYQYASHLKEMVAIEREAYEKAQADRRKAQAETLAVKDELQGAQQRYRLAEADIKALHEKLEEQAEDYDGLRQRIQGSPASDDGTVAPVLRSMLESLP